MSSHFKPDQDKRTLDDTEGHMPFQRSLTQDEPPAGSLGTEDTEGHMPFRRTLTPHEPPADQDEAHGWEAGGL